VEDGVEGEYDLVHHGGAHDEVAGVEDPRELLKEDVREEGEGDEADEHGEGQEDVRSGRRLVRELRLVLAITVDVGPRCSGIVLDVAPDRGLVVLVAVASPPPKVRRQISSAVGGLRPYLSDGDLPWAAQILHSWVLPLRRQS